MGVRTYNVNEVDVIYGGVPIRGGGESDFITITADDDLWSDSTGTHGEVTRSRRNNSTAQVDITLKNSAAGNDVLDGFKQADKATGLGALPLSITDRRGTSVYFSPQAWIMREPDTEFNLEAGERTWNLKCADMEYKHGSNV